MNSLNSGNESGKVFVKGKAAAKFDIISKNTAAGLCCSEKLRRVGKRNCKSVCLVVK